MMIQGNTAAATQHGRVLIVDDEAAQMRALCSTLEIEGYFVAGFTVADEALALLRKQPFDLLLTDLTMPQMNGIEVLDSAREIDPQLVGIVMTGHGSIDSAVAAMKAGALDYILKPFTLRTLLPVLERALTVRHLHRENVQLREAESAVRRLNASLERRVEERTRQLTDANRELEAFSHSVSHDLRAPLRSITGFGAMLIEQHGTELDERARGYIDRMLTAATRMGGLIEDLMRLSRITGAELRRVDVDLSAMAEGIIDELRARDPGRHVTTSIRAHLRVNADPQLLRIALENLLGNAWKFTRKVVGAHIELDQRDDDRGTYYVRDNGAGFDMQHAGDLFAPFRRLHSSSDFPGTGVGLSIVQRIIRRHGGSIDAHGAVGKGATFFFSIPTPPELHS